MARVKSFLRGRSTCKSGDLERR